jgi:hypothetical protein
MRFDKYFNYLHLPQFLQDVSKPFAECYNSVKNDSNIFAKIAIENLIDKVRQFSSNDIDETDMAICRLISAKDSFDLPYPNKKMILRFLLEAKDCAVRAALPD